MEPIVTSVTPEHADPRVARSRAKVLAAARDLLVETGPAAVTVDAVAERSGVAKSTFYRQWASRTDLLVDVIRSHVPLLHLPPAELDFEAALRWLLDEVAGSLADPEWLRILPAILSLQHTVPEIAEVLAADLAAKTGIVGAVLTRGVAEGRFPEYVEPTVATRLLVGPLVLGALSGAVDEMPALAAEVAERFLASYR